jgi:hypothetical protein
MPLHYHIREINLTFEQAVNFIYFAQIVNVVGVGAVSAQSLESSTGY